MIGAFTSILVAGVVLAIFATTRSGQALVTKLGLRRLQQGAAPDEDRDFLLRSCSGNLAEVEARLSAESERYPDSNEAQLYRRAIRTYMNTRGGADAERTKEVTES